MERYCQEPRRHVSRRFKVDTTKKKLLMQRNEKLSHFSYLLKVFFALQKFWIREFYFQLLKKTSSSLFKIVNIL